MKNKNIILKIFLFTFLISSFSLSTRTFANVPPALNIQGRLTDENRVNRDGSFTIVFTIYDQSASGTELWKKTYTNVQVSNGNFQVLVGSPDGKDDTNRDISSIFNGSNRWLGIAVAGEPELIPRQLLATVPHSFVADKLTTPTVPIGTILDWYRPTTTTPVPEGFQICDGSLISDPISPFNGQNIPNLTDRITYGVTLSRMDSHETGGTNTLVGLQHAHSVGVHQHSMGHTHGYNGNTSGTGVGTTVQGGGGASIVHENHTHSFSGSTADSSIVMTGGQGSGTDSQLASSYDIRQAYVGVIKIIRIK